MCGIFGIVAERRYADNFMVKTLKCLALLSESRGKESSGFVFRKAEDRTFSLLKGPIPVSMHLKEKRFGEALNSFLADPQPIRAAIGHSRLVTNGSMLSNQNNQPVVYDGVIGVHNGIIVNYQDLWKALPDLQPRTDLDTEVMIAHIAQQTTRQQRLDQAVGQVLTDVFGTVATAVFWQDLNALALATNNGSLYYLTNNKDFLAFASEQYILKTLAELQNLENHIGSFTIHQLHVQEGVVVNLTRFDVQPFGIDSPTKEHYKAVDPFGIELIEFDNIRAKLDTLVDVNQLAIGERATRERKMLQYNDEAIQRLKRCTKCLLSETFPHISFNEGGVCSICQNYKLQNQPKPFNELMSLVEPYRRPGGQTDCIVPFSGGRDSSYCLHIIKKELGLNPITLTYDWGMVTDLARRNVARVCGKLGVENIIVSADIGMKRRNIRRNVAAWLRKPDLGMVPLFMAGDKAFFYYVRQLQQQTGIGLNIWGINRLENTDFKVGFCGVKPDFDKKNIYTLKPGNMLRLGWHVLSNFVANPAYLNESLQDNIQSGASRYLPKTDYFNFFDYQSWDEQDVNRTIIDNYDWELAIDTPTTWRIGDGTAAFYNYIYHSVAGFTEFDTFRSNQIREGMITREQGMAFIEVENRPRYETIRWYLDIIGLDFEYTIKRINKIPRLYTTEKH